MGKGARSKVKRRWRALRRNYIDEILEVPLVEEISKKLEASIHGIEYRQTEPKNAFMHPNDPEAVIPKIKPQKIIDLRSSAIPGSGLEYVGAMRKKFKPVEESEDEDDKQKGVQQMQVEKVRPRIGKFERTKKECKKSKKLIAF